jgi:hypothetical protein
MDGKADQEGDSVLISLEFGSRRAVVRHGAEDLRDASGAAFSEVELLEELADAAVTVAAGNGPTGPKLVELGAPLRAPRERQRLRPRNR